MFGLSIRLRYEPVWATAARPFRPVYVYPCMYKMCPPLVRYDGTLAINVRAPVI